MGLRIRSTVVAIAFALVGSLLVQHVDAGGGVDASAFKFVDDAEFDGSSIVLTNGLEGQAGAAWTKRKNVAKPWVARFTIVVSGDADGMAFVIQDDRRGAVGDAGGSLGYGGIPRSLAIEFDEFENTENGDSAFDHLGVHTRGRKRNTANEAAALAPGSVPLTFADGTQHDVAVAYSNKTLTVTVDAAHVLTVPVNLVRKLGLEDRKAHVGFTAATGGETATHAVTAFSFGHI